MRYAARQSDEYAIKKLPVCGSAAIAAFPSSRGAPEISVAALSLTSPAAVTVVA